MLEAPRRSGLLGLAVVAGVFLWRWRGSRGLLAGVVVVGIALVVVGSELLRAVPAVADQQRVEAWAASVRIWLTYPLEGAGFRSFEWLHAQFGSPLLDAPHNEWLRLLAEEGVLVGLAGVVFAVLTPVYALRARGWIGVGAAAAAAGLFLMACFNNPFLYAQVNVPAFIVIGMGLGLAQRALPEPAPSGCP